MSTADDLPGDEHAEFIQWALSEGVDIHAVTPAKFPDRGLGMVATRTIEENEDIVKVPVSLMLTIDSIPESFIKQFPEGASIQGILATYLTHGDSDRLRKWDVWRKVWPQRQDFEDSMPILWPEHLEASKPTSIFPPSASGNWNTISTKPLDVEYETKYQNLLTQQRKRLNRSWEDVISVFPNTDWDSFSYYWLIINTRSFYYVPPGAEDPEDWNDALGLIPFVDYFNHSNDPPCKVFFDETEYTIRASRIIEKGEEVYISYGLHPNDFLFIEYGFFLDHNPSDAVYLDDIILQELTTSDKDNLRQHDCYGNYQLTSAGPCSRTEAVVCVKYMNSEDLEKYLFGKSTKAVDPQRTADIIRGWVNIYLKESETAIENLQAMLRKEHPSQTLKDTGNDWSREDKKVSTILRRWNQIKSLCEDALNSLDFNKSGLQLKSQE